MTGGALLPKAEEVGASPPKTGRMRVGAELPPYEGVLVRLFSSRPKVPEDLAPVPSVSFSGAQVTDWHWLLASITRFEAWGLMHAPGWGVGTPNRQEP